MTVHHKRQGRRHWWVPLLLAIVVLGVPIRASATEAAHWSGPVHLGAARPGFPTAVACVSPTACRTIDSQGNATTYDGTRWLRVHNVVREFGALYALSCPSDFCAAVGGRRAVIRTADGWGRMRVLPVRDLFAVSCASRHFCLALGSTGLAVRYDGARWGSPIPAPAHLTSLSCTSRTFCLALAEDGGAHRYDGHVWRRAGEVPASANESAVACLTPTFCLAATGTQLVARYHGARQWTTRHVADGFVPDAMACSGSAFCIAVATAGGLAARFDGAWHQPAQFHDYGEGLTPQTPDRVSCPARGRCLVVDELGTAFVLDHGWHDAAPYPGDRMPTPAVSCPSATFCMAVDGDGGAWRRSGDRWVRTLDRPTQLPRPWLRYAAVSCTSAHFCAAVDAGARAMTWDGSAWSTATQLPKGRWSNLVCTSASSCMAIDATGESVSQVLLFDGDTWTDAGVVTLGLVGALDCPAADVCWAGGGAGDVSRYDGVGWSVPQQIVGSTDGDGLNRLSWMSCPTTTSCATHDQYGGLYRLDGTVWSTSTVDVTRRMGPLSCATGSSCTVVDGRSSRAVRRFDGGGWSSPQRFVPRGYDSTTTGLSCPTPAFCVAVDTNGNAFVRQ